MMAFGRKKAILASRTPTEYSPDWSSVRKMRASRTSTLVRVKSTNSACTTWMNSLRDVT